MKLRLFLILHLLGCTTLLAQVTTAPRLPLSIDRTTKRINEAAIKIPSGTTVTVESGGVLTVASGGALDFSASTNTLPSNIATLTGAQTLTNKTLTAPVLGAATATSINGLTITSSTGTLTITNAKTLAVTNTLTFAGTDGSALNVGAGGTLASGAFAPKVVAKTKSADETRGGATPAIDADLQFAAEAASTYVVQMALAFTASANAPAVSINLPSGAAGAITLLNAGDGTPLVATSLALAAGETAVTDTSGSYTGYTVVATFALTTVDAGTVSVFWARGDAGTADLLKFSSLTITKQ